MVTAMLHTKDRQDILDMKIEDTGMPNRARRWLQVAGIETVGELTQRTETDLLTIRNFADTSLTHVREFLDRNGLSLAPERDQRCSTEWVKEALSDPEFEVSKRERHILELRHGLRGERPLTLEETGRIFKLTRERVRQIQKKAEEKVAAYVTFGRAASVA